MGCGQDIRYGVWPGYKVWGVARGKVWGVARI